MVTHRTYGMTTRATVRPPKEAVSLLGGREGGISWWQPMGDVDSGGDNDDVTHIKDEDDGAISGNNNDNSRGIELERQHAHGSDEYEALLWKPTLDLRMVSQVEGSLCSLYAP